MNQTQIAAEMRFFDAEYSKALEYDLAINPRMFRLYEPPFSTHFRSLMAAYLHPVRGKDLLDYGCGQGEESMYFAALGATVTAIDISPVGVEVTNRRAAANKLAVTARVMDATPTGFPDESFDRIHGLGILHHVGIAAGLSEAARLLRPGGRAVFAEHMSNAALLDWMRRHLQSDAPRHTDDERPLTWDDCTAAVKRFRNYSLVPYAVSTRLRHRMPLFERQVFYRLDRFALRVLPALRMLAGGILICVER